MEERTAGRRKGKGCTGQIFTLRNISEQRQPYVNFVDFEKAFESVHRENLWRVKPSAGKTNKETQKVALKL